MQFKDILSVLSGLAIFLYGMEVMGNGFKHMAGGKLQDILEKLTKKPLVALLAGTLITALVQSSGATTSMLVSFVNAGIMRVAQTVFVIMGANIGTTITGHLMALDVGLVAPFIAFIGVCFIMFVKQDRINAIGEIMMGLGFVFIGMDTMSSGLQPLGQSRFFLRILTTLQNPLIGIVVGFALTTIVQSSSASLGIVQSLAKSGLIQIKDVMFFNLGQKIGACTTAMLASLSFNRDAKRVSIINFVYNVFGAILFVILYTLLPFDRFYQSMAPDNVVRQIALMHTIVSVITTLFAFPLAQLFVRIAYMIIPDQGSKKYLHPEIEQPAKIENNSVFNIYGINIEIDNMFDLVETSIQKSLIAILEHYSVLPEVNQNEQVVNTINEGISKNLMLLMASNINMQEAKQAASMFSINVDLERMSDHAVNLAEAGEDLVNGDLSFSVNTYDEIQEVATIIMESLNHLNSILESGELSYLEQIQKNEDLIDDLCYKYRNVEIERMKKDNTDTATGIIYSEMLIDIERIGDHIMNVAESVVSNYKKD